MRRVISSLVPVLSSAAVGAALLFTPATARADATCTSLMSQVNYWFNQGYVADFKVVMHRSDTNFVSYVEGPLYLYAGAIQGSGWQLFSDRRTGTNGDQPFDYNRHDGVAYDLSPSGAFHIHYETWNFDTTWDMSCQEGMMYTFLPGYGFVTASIQNYHHITL